MDQQPAPANADTRFLSLKSAESQERELRKRSGEVVLEQAMTGPVQHKATEANNASDAPTCWPMR